MGTTSAVDSPVSYIRKSLHSLDVGRKYRLSFHVTTVPNGSPFHCTFSAHSDGVLLYTSGLPSYFFYAQYITTFTPSDTSAELEFQARCTTTGNTEILLALDRVSVIPYILPCTVATDAPSETCGTVGYLPQGALSGAAISLEACANMCTLQRGCMSFAWVGPLGSCYLSHVPSEAGTTLAHFYSRDCFKCGTTCTRV